MSPNTTFNMILKGNRKKRQKNKPVSTTRKKKLTTWRLEVPSKTSTWMLNDLVSLTDQKIISGLLYLARPFLKKWRRACQRITILDLIIFNISPHAVRISSRPRQSLWKSSQYCLFHSAKESITAIIKAAGKDCDAAQVDAVLKAVNNRKVDEVSNHLSRSSAKVSLK